MVDLQRKLGKEGGVVFRRKRYWNSVFPEAEAKFFMVADLEVRAKRRFNELAEKE